MVKGQNISQDNKRLAKNSLFLYIRLIVTLCINLYASRAILDILGVEDYGIYNVVGGFVTMFTVLTGSIRSAAQRFITYSLGKGDVNNQKSTFATFTTLLTLISIVILIVVEIVGVSCLDYVLNLPANRIDAAYYVFHCSTVTLVITLLAIPYDACVIAHERLDFYAIISMGESFLKLVLILLLYHTHFDKLMVYATFLCAVSVAVRVIYGVYCKKNFVETRVKLSIDKKIFREVFSYSAWMIMGTSSAVFKEQGVNLVINNFFGVTMNAARGIGNQVSSIVGQFANNIGQAINPQITKNYAAGNVTKSIKLTFFSTKIQGIFMLIICIPLFVEIDYVLSLWLKEVPHYANVFARWALILTLCRNLQNSIIPLMLAVGKVKYPQLVAASTMLLNLPISYVALKLGADAVSTMIIGSVIEIIVLIQVSLFLKYYIQFPIRSYLVSSVFPIFLIGISASIVPSIMIKKLPSDSFACFFIICFTAVLITCMLSWLLAFNKEERNKIIKIIKHRNNENI